MKKIHSVLLILFLLTSCTAPSVLYAPTASPQEPSVFLETLPSLAPSTVPSPEHTPVIIEQEPSPEPEDTTVKIQFAGDILLHANPVKYAKTGEATYDFKPYLEAIKPYINGDLAICNMETPVDVNGGNTGLSGYPTFNAPYEILEALQYAGFNHLLTANNHSFDKGAPGLEATLENISKAGLSSTGTYADEEAFNTPTVLDVEGLKVGIVAYTYAVNGLESTVPKDRLPYLIRRFHDGSLNDLPRMTEDIATLREAGAELVIVALHWGAEYVDKPTQTQRDIAQGLCEAGADVILGGHSHCVQPMEWVEVEREGETVRCLVMYSLGNFLSDQLAMDVPKLKTQYGMLVSLNVKKTPKGVVTLEECSALPTLFYRERGTPPEGGYNYSLLPLAGYGADDESEQSAAQLPQSDPDIGGGDTPLPSNDAWEWGREAYQHVLNIVGDEFVR